MKENRSIKHVMYTWSLLFLFLSCNNSAVKYFCTPCDLPCDDLVFAKPGTCPHCNMDLIEKPIELELNKIDIEEGSGTFLIEGGVASRGKTIKVFYHRPRNYTSDSRILLVIPGAGRNADSYRDAWVEEAEKYNVLILSPQFKESDYGFEDYHLGGLIKKTNLLDCVEFSDTSNVAHFYEDRFQFEVNESKGDLIFADLDRMFDLVVEKLGSNRRSYDAFGHSAGGHILHRMAIFHRSKKVDRLIAANPSFYTLTDNEVKFPFGLGRLVLEDKELEAAFITKLLVFLGEKDDRDEDGGTFLRSNSADLQGLSRVERGKYFFEFSKAKARDLGVEFNWQLKIISNVGHDHRGMGDAAGKILYGQ